MAEIQTGSQPKPRPNPAVERASVVFSHPSEAELANVLDFYGIDWRYEPTTFPIFWDEHGNLKEAFTPDFYLVEQELYVELTTLRAKLMKVKHRKLRRMRELYPEVNVRLWNRSDFMNLLKRFAIQDREPELVGKEAVGK